MTVSGAVASRGRAMTVVTLLVGAAIVLISSTQVWATTEVDGLVLSATGAEAISLVQPLSFAGLALSLAIALTGRVARMVLAVVAVVIGVSVVWLVVPIGVAAPVSAVESVVTEHTGIAGAESVAGLVSVVEVNAWPWIAGVAGLAIALGGVLAAVTGASWRRGGHRYDAPAVTGGSHHDGPLDAVDSWDELTRGDDPTRGG